MKKHIISYTILAGALIASLASCVNEEADIFDMSAAERLDAAKQTYSDRLIAGQHGWIFQYFNSPETDQDNYVKGLGFQMLAKFDADHSVTVSMQNNQSGDTLLTDRSAWEIITDRSAVLSFNTFNRCIHAFSNPENFAGSTSAYGDIGKGMLGDYEFIMVDVPEEVSTITLKGKKHGAYSFLVPLQEDATPAEYFKDVKAHQNLWLSNSAPNHLVVNVGDKKTNFIMPAKGGELGLAKTWPEGTDSTFTQALNPIILSRLVAGADTTYMLYFRDAFTAEDGDGELRAQEFCYDAASQSFVGLEGNASIVGEDVATFLNEKWPADCRLQIPRTASGSEKGKQLLADLTAAYTALKYTFQSVTLQRGETGAVVTVAYKTNKGASGTIKFNYTCQQSGNSLALQYIEPANSASELQYTNLEALRTLLAAFSGTYQVTPGSSALNLSTLTLQSTADASLSFVANFMK